MARFSEIGFLCPNPLPIPEKTQRLLTCAEISARMYVKIADFDLIFSSDPLALNEIEEPPPINDDSGEENDYVTLDDVEKFKRKIKENDPFCRVQSFDKFDAWSYTNSVASSWDSKDDFLSETEVDFEENLKKTLKKVGFFKIIYFIYFLFS